MARKKVFRFIKTNFGEVYDIIFTNLNDIEPQKQRAALDNAIQILDRELYTSHADAYSDYELDQLADARYQLNKKKNMLKQRRAEARRALQARRGENVNGKVAI